ncbi:CAP domain-containing protein [Actinocorallia longicatena]|uniref:SCP domain-containing protein n=1 Tax=Actinocorallia longicatena TaxID=111803 RepID=A0ABP6QDZ5_9ACTN
MRRVAAAIIAFACVIPAPGAHGLEDGADQVIGEAVALPAGPAVQPAAPAHATVPAAATSGTTGPSVSSSTMTPAELEVVEFTNERRSESGCPPLRAEKSLANSARRHSADMAAHDFFSHSSWDGTSWIDRITKSGYRRPGAENIAAGYTSAEATVRAWMRSGPHRANILNCELVALGIGHVRVASGYRNYWTQDFGW